MQRTSEVFRLAAGSSPVHAKFYLKVALPSDTAPLCKLVLQPVAEGNVYLYIIVFESHATKQGSPRAVAHSGSAPRCLLSISVLAPDVGSVLSVLLILFACTSPLRIMGACILITSCCSKYTSSRVATGGGVPAPASPFWLLTTASSIANAAVASFFLRCYANVAREVQMNKF